MKADTFTISLPAPPCPVNCPYCISKMTWRPRPDPKLFEANLDRAAKTAVRSGVTSVLLTSKDEPLHSSSLEKVGQYLKTFALEIQVNAKNLFNGLEDNMARLAAANIQVLAVSEDEHLSKERYEPLMELMERYGMIGRLTYALTRYLAVAVPANLIRSASQAGFRQVTFRVISAIPTAPTNAVAWIEKNANPLVADNFISNLRAYLYGYPEIRFLRSGAVVYDVKGIAVTFMEYCIQDSAEEDEIRSLIYHHDGHLYTSWDSKASILW